MGNIIILLKISDFIVPPFVGTGLCKPVNKNIKVINPTSLCYLSVLVNLRIVILIVIDNVYGLNSIQSFNIVHLYLYFCLKIFLTQ